MHLNGYQHIAFWQRQRGIKDNSILLTIDQCLGNRVSGKQLQLTVYAMSIDIDLPTAAFAHGVEIHTFQETVTISCHFSGIKSDGTLKGKVVL